MHAHWREITNLLDAALDHLIDAREYCERHGLALPASLPEAIESAADARGEASPLNAQYQRVAGDAPEAA